MPRYFFHTLDALIFRDQDGEDMAGPAAAQKEALRIMGDILRDGSSSFWDTGAFSVLCTDRGGEVVFGLTANRVSVGEAVSLLARVNEDEA